MAIFKKLKKHIEAGSLSAHMPGHKSGRFLPEQLEEAFGKNIFDFDITEIEGMDNLQNPQGIIKITENKIAQLTGAEEAFILVNGSTGGILAGIFAMARNKQIFVAGNSHQAVYNAILLAGADPIFLAPELDLETGTELGVSPETLREAISSYPDCKIIILTLPNYYGIRYEYKEIIKTAKDKNIKIIIDEAHGAHYNFMGKNYPNGIKSGADLVIQSWHKSLPVLNQGSVLLRGLGGRDFNFRESINLFQTSSPSYLIMTSIDLAADFLQNQEEKLLKAGIKWQNLFRNLTLLNLEIFKYEKDYTDPFKVLIYSKKKTDDLFREIIIEKYKVQPEIIDQERILFMLPLIYDELLAEKIKRALIELDSKLSTKELLVREEEPRRERILKLYKTPQEISFIKKESLPLLESIGRICGEKIVKYPPGVPLVYPGQMLKEEIVCYLKRHKINYSLQEGIQILADQEN